MRLLLTFACLLGAVHGLIGIDGFRMYNPSCAFGCRRAIASTPLECSHNSHSAGHHGSGKTSASCFAHDTPFLTTLAWCIKTYCEPYQIPTYRLEKYWYDKATNDAAVQAKWTYSEALGQVVEAPTRVVNTSGLLDYTGLVSESKFRSNQRGLEYFEWQESLHARYGIVLLVAGVATPIVFTMLTLLPGITRLTSWLKPYLVLPSMLGSYHSRSLPYDLGKMPTVGQGLYIFVFILLNLFLTAMPYKSGQPNAFLPTSKEEILVYVANRTGCIAFALAPLTILFAGRNNFLLWVTNWSHSTYLLLHRWVARIFTLQCILHSILEVVLYKYQGEYETQVKMPYWIWGIVATLCATILVIVSTLYFRKLAYEAFLTLHVLLAAFVIIGSWYHVELLFTRKWGYEQWLYAATAVWFFDRLCRVVWTAKNGIRTGHVKDIGDGILRVDIPGPRWSIHPGQHAYVYFPGVKSWLFWQCHPFSVIPLIQCNNTINTVTTNPLPALNRLSNSSSQAASELDDNDIEKSQPSSTARAQTTNDSSSSINDMTRPIHYSGIRLYLRKHKGITQYLSHLTQTRTLIEGPYYNHNPSFNTSVLRSDRLILLAGGIGITGVASFIAAHPLCKLYWSVKSASQSLVDDVTDSGILSHSTALGPRNDHVIKIGGPRWDFDTLLSEECSVDRPRTRMGIVVCGPSSFCDNVRAAVVSVGKRTGIDFELWEEAFSW